MICTINQHYCSSGLNHCFVLVIVVLFFSKHVIAQTDNFILNPGFEIVDTSTNTNTASWTKTGTGGGKIISNFGADNSTYHTGVASMKVDVTSVAPTSNQWVTVKINSTHVPVPQPGTWMMLQLWMKVAYENNSDLEPMRLVYLRFYNDSDVPPIASFVAMHNGDENDWHLREKLIQVPAGAVTAVVELGVYNNVGTIWFDDISLTEVYSTEQKDTLSSAVQNVLLPHLIPEPQIRGGSFAKRAVK